MSAVTRIRNLAAVAALLSAAMIGGAQAAEVCGDGLDNDTDLLADEGCNATAVTGLCASPLSCAEAGSISPVKGAHLHFQIFTSGLEGYRTFPFRMKLAPTSVGEPQEGDAYTAWETPAVVPSE